MVENFEVVYDDKRHLVTVPYSRVNLHAAAEALGLKRHWFHASPYPHYDLPKSWVADFGLKLDEQLLNLDIRNISYRQTTARELLRICRGSKEGEESVTQ